jgi:hypothetical protein
MTIGIVVVASFAALMAGGLTAAITSTRALTRSAGECRELIKPTGSESGLHHQIPAFHVSEIA